MDVSGSGNWYNFHATFFTGNVSECDLLVDGSLNVQPNDYFQNKYGESFWKWQ